YLIGGGGEAPREVGRKSPGERGRIGVDRGKGPHPWMVCVAAHPSRADPVRRRASRSSPGRRSGLVRIRAVGGLRAASATCERAESGDRARLVHVEGGDDGP